MPSEPVRIIIYFLKSACQQFVFLKFSTFLGMQHNVGMQGDKYGIFEIFN